MGKLVGFFRDPITGIFSLRCNISYKLKRSLESFHRNCYPFTKSISVLNRRLTFKAASHGGLNHAGGTWGYRQQ